MEQKFNLFELAKTSIRGIDEGFSRFDAVIRSLSDYLTDICDKADLNELIGLYNDTMSSLSSYEDIFFENDDEILNSLFDSPAECARAVWAGEYNFCDEWVRKEGDDNLYSYSENEVREIIADDDRFFEDWLNVLELDGIVEDILEEQKYILASM